MESENTAGSTAVGTVGIAPEIRAKLEVDTRGMVERANALEITNEMQNTEALKFASTLKQEIKSREAILAPSKVALDAQKAAFAGLQDILIKPLKQCAEIIGGKAGTFVKQENARRAELQRQEDEKLAAAQQKEQERLDKATAKAEATGKPVKIVPRYIPPARTVNMVSAPAGTGLSTLWRAEIKDLPALLRAIADGTEPQYLVEIKMAELNSRATGIKQEGATIAPGVIAVSKISPSLRG